ELLAAKFHVAPALLTRLNPKASFETAGTKIVVPNVARKPSHDKVAEVVVDKSALTVRVLDANGKLISFYPASVGSTDRPSPCLAACAASECISAAATQSKAAMQAPAACLP